MGRFILALLVLAGCGSEDGCSTFGHGFGFGPGRPRGNDAVGGGPVCGNGAVEAGETCDDAGTTAGDGCSATCAIETNAFCVTGSAPSVCYEWDPSLLHSAFGGPGVETLFVASAGATSNALVQQRDNTGATIASAYVTAAAQNVGSWREPAWANTAHSVGTNSATYQTSPERVVLTGGTSERMEVTNTRNSLECIHVNGIGTVFTRLNFPNDTEDHTILDSCSFNASNTGWGLRRIASTDRIQGQVCNGSGTFLFNNTPTNTTAGDGTRYDLGWRFNNASGGDANISVVGSAEGTPQTFSRTSAPSSTADATSDLILGMEQGTTDGDPINFEVILVSCARLTDAQMTLLHSCDATCWARALEMKQATLPNATSPSFPYPLWARHVHDATLEASRWEDTARTNPASSGDSVRVLDNIIDGSTQHMGRGAVAAADNRRPIAQTGDDGVLFDWDGDLVAALTDYDQLIFSDNASGPEGGPRTLVLSYRMYDVGPLTVDDISTHPLTADASDPNSFYKAHTGCERTLSTCDQGTCRCYTTDHINPGLDECAMPFDNGGNGPSTGYPVPALDITHRTIGGVFTQRVYATGYTSQQCNNADEGNSVDASDAWRTYSLGTSDRNNPTSGTIQVFAEWIYPLSATEIANVRTWVCTNMTLGCP